MRKRITSALLTLVMLLSLIPAMGTTASAADSVGIKIENNNTDDTSGTGWSYEKSTKTLTLDGYSGGLIYVGVTGEGFNLVLKGNNTITGNSVSEGGDYSGIYCNNVNLNISGSGSLTINATGNSGTRPTYGIYANEVTMSGGTVAINAGSNTTQVYGVYARNSKLGITGGTLTANIVGTSDGYGLFCKGGEITVDSGAGVNADIKNNGSSQMYGIYNEAGNVSGGTGNGDIKLAGTVKVTRNTESTGSGYVQGIANGSSTSNTDGVISVTGGTVTVQNAYFGIAAYTKGHSSAYDDVRISGGTVNITSNLSSSNGIVSWNNGITISGGNVTANTASAALLLQDSDSGQRTGLVKIKNSAVVSLTSTGNYSNALMVKEDNKKTSTRVHQIDLTSGGKVTIKSTESYPVRGYFSLGSNTGCTQGRLSDHSDDVNTGGGKLFVSDGTTKQVVVEYQAAASAANINLDKTGTVDFGSMEAGYTTAPAALTVTITNSGTAATGELNIALDGDNKTDFTLSKNNISDIAASSTDTFTVQPKTELTAGTYNATVKVSGAGVTEQKFDVKFTVTAPATTIAVPTANTGLVYNGTKQTGVNAGTGYTLGGTYEAIDVGATDYAATATLNTGYKWTDGSTDVKTIHWNIGKRTPTVTDFTFAAPTNLTYDGNNKTASVTLNSPLTKSGTITPTYMKGGSVVTETKDVGTYTVKIDVAGGDNFNAGSDLTASAWTFSIAPANQNAPTGLGVAAPTASGGKGKITGTTTAMEYNTDAAATSGWTACSATETEVAPGTYYVRFKADSNHHAGATATVTVPAYSATKYTVTVTSDANGTASADKTANVAAGETVTLTATPNSGYVFDKWDDKTPAGLTIGADGKFTMPSGNVSVKATFKGAALTGTVSITGILKYGQELTATLTGDNNTGNLDYKWYQNGTTQVAANNTGKYTLRADDIGKTITVKITSSVQTGEITSSTTGTIEKADSPAAPTAFTLTFTPNADGTTFTATIPTVAGGEYSFDGTTYSTTNTKTDCAANTSYTGYARIAETSTHKASAATSNTQTSPKLTVATPTFTPNGASSFTGTQSVTIFCTTAGATIHYTTDGTDPTASSPVYSTALSLTSTATVKAIAVKAGMADSAIATATFTKYSGGGGGGSYTPSYTVSVDKTENGTIAVSPKSASKGDTVTITVTPDKGYELEMLKALDKNGDALKLTEKNGKYTFKMPSGKVTVKGSFVEEAPEQIFKDVPVDAYYYEAVKWAAEKGITGGVGNGLFAPNQPCTRAQIVTFLWRVAGSPAPKNMSSFADVSADAFYAKAVAWAVENGITGGTGDGKFSPDATCTRAQSVTFLYRASGSPAVSGSAAFSDVAADAYYASAVKWAEKNGITGGIGGGLFGSDNNCTRGQIVTFLYRAMK